MKITNLSVQSFLFKDGKERFFLAGRAMFVEAPEWIANNRQANRLKKEEKVSFEKKIKITYKQKLLNRIEELGKQAGDGATINALEEILGKDEVNALKI